MSRLSDQVEAKIARANRAFRLSSRIIAAANEELEGHGEWLDRHRATWALEVKRHRRLLNRKLATRALMQSAVGLVFALPFAIARELKARLKDVPSRSSPQPRLADPPLTRHDALQLRIRGLDQRFAAVNAASPPPVHKQVATRSGFSFAADGALSFARAALGSVLKQKGLVAALGAVALLLIAAGGVRGTITSAPAEPQARIDQEAPVASPGAAEASMTVTKAPRQAESPAPASGFAVVATPPSSEALHLPAQTIADMMSISRPLSGAPAATKTVPAPVAEESPATKPAAKAKPKRKAAAREPAPLPWWQQWSWIRVR